MTRLGDWGTGRLRLGDWGTGRLRLGDSGTGRLGLGDWGTGRVRALVALVALALLGAESLSAQTQPATVILVRHAEKEAEPKDDPPLSAVGRERVRALWDAVRESGVSLIYSTPKRRNLETAQPIADSLRVGVIQVPIEGGKIDVYARDVAQRVKKDGGGRVSLVVGHSNTLGPVITALGGPAIEEIADPRYDDLFIVIVQDGRPTRLVRGKFGQRWVP